jgi:predicted ATP-dependent serine protease
MDFSESKQSSGTFECASCKLHSEYSAEGKCSHCGSRNRDINEEMYDDADAVASDDVIGIFFILYVYLFIHLF